MLLRPPRLWKNVLSHTPDDKTAPNQAVADVPGARPVSPGATIAPHIPALPNDLRSAFPFAPARDADALLAYAATGEAAGLRVLYKPEEAFADTLRKSGDSPVLIMIGYKPGNQDGAETRSAALSVAEAATGDAETSALWFAPNGYQPHAAASAPTRTNNAATAYETAAALTVATTPAVTAAPVLVSETAAASPLVTPSASNDATPEPDATTVQPMTAERKSERAAALRRDGFTTGLSAAFGAAVLALLLFLSWRFMEATLAIAMPFVAAVAVSLVLDPVVSKIQKYVTHGKRLPALLLVFLLFLLGFAALVVFVLPSLIGQAQNLILKFPDYFQNAREAINTYLETHRKIGPVQLPPDLNALGDQYGDQAVTFLRNWAGRLAGLLIGSIGNLLSVILIPIVTFYILSDFDRLRARMFYLLPSRIRPGALRAAQDVGGVFGNYVRGLFTICSIYAVSAMAFLFAMSFFGFPGVRGYALLIGFAAGILYAVPYVGALATIGLTVTVMLTTGGGASGAIIAAVALFALNQLFDNVLMPRIVGGGVGLHPILSLFALLLGANLFGLWGMLLSVPVAASIQAVLFRLYPRLAAPTPISMLLGLGGKEARKAEAEKQAHEAER